MGRTLCVLLSLALLKSMVTANRGPSSTQHGLDTDSDWVPAPVMLSKIQASLANFAARAPKSDGQQPGQPVSMQVPEEEINEFVSKLSDKCAKQFSAILTGESPSLHSFGGPDSNTSETECHNLHGHICMTQAHVVEMKTNSTRGRNLRSTVDVEGKGCLPDQCVADKDLNLLAGFMRTQAKNTIPGQDVNVQLRVDCTASGGSTASVGFIPGDPAAVQAKSSATGIAASAPLLLALMLLSQ